MASTYGNDLRLEEIGNGEQSGSWGTTTNTNLELIAEALSFGTEAITTNANTHTTTIADGATDPGRSLYLKYTGTLDSACTITIAPNSISKTWYIENGTSGSQSIIISQGSGANVTIKTGQTKIVYSDGAGSGAAMGEVGTLAVANLAVDTNATISGNATITGNIDVDGTTNLDAVDIDGAVQLDSTLTVGANDQGYDVTLHGDTAARNATWDSSADSLIFTDNTKAVFGTGSDASIFFDGTDMKVGATAGHLDLFTSEVGSSVRILGSGESLAEFTDDGDVDLFHNGTLKMSTTATGITVAGSVVDNLTRGSIKVGNSSGVFAELTKGGAATVLTSDGTDLSWAEAGGGGGEQTFTAGAAISAGNPVGFIGSTIKPLEVKVPAYSTATNRSNAANASDPIIIYSTVDNKYLYIYNRSTAVYAVVGVPDSGTGTGITWSTTQTLVASSASNATMGYEPTTNRFVIAYTNQASSNYWSCRVGYINGTSSVWGSNITIRSQNIGGQTDVKSIGSSKMALSQNSSNNYTRLGTVSGTSISFGTTYGPDSSVGFNCIGYHAASGKLIQVMGPNIKARVATISGTSLSFGAFTTLKSSTLAYKGDLNYDSTSEVMVWFGIPYTGGIYQPTAIPLTVSGTTIVKGITLVDGPFVNAELSVGYETPYTVCVGGKFYVFDGYYSDVMAELPIVGSGANARFGAANYVYISPGFPTLAGTANNNASIGAGPSNEIAIISLSRVAGSSSDMLSYSLRYKALTPFFVGVAAENISSGAEGKVTIIGGINTSVSGLSAGSEYGPVDTAVTLSALSRNNIGRALASNKLYVSNVASPAVGKL